MQCLRKIPSSSTFKFDKRNRFIKPVRVHPLQNHQPAIVHHVFVGNLAYVTTDEGLKAFFAPVQSEIAEAVQKAAELLNKTELDGREVVVEVAKPSDEKDKERKEKKAKRRPAGVVPKPFPVRTPAPDAEGATQAAPKKAGRVRKPRVSRPEGEDPAGEPSKTMLFVANLGFSVDDAASPLCSRGRAAEGNPGLDGKEVTGRAIAVKVAVNTPHSESEGEGKDEANPDAPAVPAEAPLSLKQPSLLTLRLLPRRCCRRRLIVCFITPIRSGAVDSVTLYIVSLVPNAMLFTVILITPVMSDEEDDYFSDKFLAAAALTSSAPKTYSSLRKQSQLRSQLKNEQGRTKSRRQRELESREQGLSQSLFERAKDEQEAGVSSGNKALSIMMKMGFKPGQALGQTDDHDTGKSPKPQTRAMKPRRTTSLPVFRSTRPSHCR
ncbi:RNA-binding domain-containing protein [Salix suchowensis]|nr:RNA-binding domain-containing protein [Salix suchowensis]